VPRGNAVRLGPFENLGPIDQSPDAPVIDAPEFENLGPVPGGSLPVGMKPTGEASATTPAEPPKSLLDRAKSHFMGTDVNDPVPIPRLAATIIGGLGGAQLGAEAGAALGPGALATGALGSLAGAVSGYAAPETTMFLARKLGLASLATQKKFSMTPEDLKNGLEGEAIVDIATSGGIGLARLVGRNVIRGMTMGLVNPEADQLAEQGAKYGVNMSPVQLGAGKVPRMFVSVFGQMPFLASPYVKTAKESQDRLLQAFKDFPDSIAPAVASSELSARVFNTAKSLTTDIVNHYDGIKAGMLAKADASGIKVGTYETVHHADDALATIEGISPAGGGVGKPKTLGPFEQVRRFINDTIMPMKIDMPNSIQYASQTMSQMDTLRKLVADQAVKLQTMKADPQAVAKALDILKGVENGLNADMLTNARGPNVKDAIQNFLAMDEQRATALNDVFNSATANRFKTFEQGGLKGTGQAGTNSMDELVNVLTSSENPQSVSDLSKLLARDPEAFKGVARSVLETKVLSAMKSGSAQGAKFDVQELADQLGVGNKNSNRYQFMTSLLDKAGGIKMPELERMLTVADRVGSVQIPNYSTFLMRRTAIGGIKSGINAMWPTALVGGAVGGGHVAFGLSAIVPSLIFLAGTRGFASAISNPNTARALRTVMSNEVSDGVRRAAFIRGLRFTVAELYGPRGKDQEVYDAMDQGVKMVVDSLDNYYQRAKEYTR
jgi:hypothetical protein